MSGVGPFDDASSRIHALLRLGADANLLGRDGLSPLMGASARGGLQVIEALLAARADVAHKSPAGLTALSAAFTAGHSEVIAALVRARGDALLQPGTKVLIHNLHSRPDMDNQTTSVVEQKLGLVDPADHRITVRLERTGTAEQATVKHENVDEIQQTTTESPFAGVQVILKDLVSKPELNGLKGMAIALNGSTGRYAVRLETGSRVAIRPSRRDVSEARREASRRQRIRGRPPRNEQGRRGCPVEELRTAWIADDDGRYETRAQGGGYLATLERLRARVRAKWNLTSK